MSETIGIVTEFNPFHNGHEYLIDAAKAACGSDSTVVCAMSGSFVQRGEPAIVSKFARARAAVSCGAGLVAELPLPWSLSSAEGFALGGVSVLVRLGITVLCFGAETEDLALLRAIAAEASAPDFIDEVKKLLRSRPELSFAAARSICLGKRLGHEAAAQAEKPNNILAVEYIRAADKLAPGLRLIPVLRAGCGHDEAGKEGITSASDLRTRILNAEDYEDFMPAVASGILSAEFAAGRGPVTLSALDDALLSRLRLLTPEDIAARCENRGGLAERIHAAVRSEGSVEDVCASAKTARYAMSAVKRGVLRAALLPPSDEIPCELPPYARILAFNNSGRAHLRTLDEAANVIVRPSSVRDLSAEAQTVFALNSAVEDLYCLAFDAAEDRKCGNDWRKMPEIV